MSKNSKAVIAALLGYSIFGFSFLFSKTALEFASPFGLLGLRFLLAFLALNFVLLFGKTKISLKGKPIGSLILLGLIQPVCYFIFETYGISLTSAAFSGIMIGTVPVVGVILGILFLGEKCSFLQGFFTLLSVFGVYLTTTGGIGSFSAKGFFLLLGAVFSAAFFTVLSRKTSEHFSALNVLTLCSPLERRFSFLFRFLKTAEISQKFFFRLKIRFFSFRFSILR